MATPAIHQFSAATADGDGITNAMLFTQRLLRELGFASEIYAGSVDRALRGRVHPMAAFPDNPATILLVHHSMGHVHAPWLTRLKSRKVLVYHNITPPELLPAQGDLRRYAKLGRQQLADWRDMVEAAVAVSPFNARELTEQGYADPHVLPLLVDLDRIRATEPDAGTLAARRDDPAFNILFVGRMVPHKRQDALIDALARLRPRLDRPARLICPGHPGDEGYIERLRRRVADHGLEGAVDLPGPVDDHRLAAEYRGCDAYASLSAHEGFGMPLIEAMAADLPVVAANAGAIPDTLGEGGLRLREPDPEAAADALQLVAEDPGLRRRMLQGQRRNLARFERPTIMAGLRRVLGALDVAPPETPTHPGGPPAGLDARVEGPFDSSYSLAIVNRELAKALDRQGSRVALRSMTGGETAAPDPACLDRDPDVARLHAADRPDAPCDAVLRNDYPPVTAGMTAPTRVLANYAWEESGFPRERVAAFNRELNLITVTSGYVAKVLRDNGVRTPIAVVGNGVDHLRTVTPARPADGPGGAAFTFLHVSSCFPRKGPDVLLEAWAAAFGPDDDVALVVKTFPNPHNTIENQLAELRRRHPRHPPIVLINRDLPPEDIAGLYQAADTVVAPSRGEGFGLPVAEAALFDVPVVATAHGGQMDVLTPETAWLVDYRFERARTHLDLPNSVWAEPDPADLVRQLRAVRAADPATRRAAAAALRRRVVDAFTWDAVAARTRRAIAALDDVPVPDLPPRVGWVTSWNTRCGIAAYAGYLACRVPPERLTVFASRHADRLAADGDNVVRCWDAGWDDDLQDLATAIRERGIEAVVIQFNFGFFDLDAFGRLLERLQADGVQTHVVLHATKDVNKPDVQMSLSRIPEALAGCTRLLVHGIDDLNRLKAFGHVANVALFPHGVGRAPAVDPEAVRARHDLGDGRILATFGFLLPHKGLEELIEAFEALRATRPDLQLVMCNALYPVGESADARDAVQARIARSTHADAITLITEYLPDDTALALLGTADAIVFPYQTTQESASGAVRFGMASGRPVATTPLPIFDDVADASHRLPGTSPAAIATGVAQILDDPDLRARLGAAQAAWLDARRWEDLSDRLWNMLMAYTRAWRDVDAEAPAAEPRARHGEPAREAAQ